MPKLHITMQPEKRVTNPLPETNMAYIFGLLFIYIALEITGMLFHPMWRDELHPWAMAGAGSSLQELMQMKVNEGHPDLWYLMVYGMRSLSDNPLALQLMHSAIAILTVFLVLRYAPFNRLQRALMVFGYFYLFEYAIISRNYAIGLLLLTAFLILSKNRYKYLVIKALLLFFMAQTSVYGLIFSIAFLLMGSFEFLYSADFRNKMFSHKSKTIVVFAIILAGITWSLYSILPQPSGYFAGSSHFTLSQLTLHETVRSVATVWKAWFPMPKMNMQFWDSNFISEIEIKLVLSLVLLFSAGVFFYRRPVVFILFFTGTTGMIAMILMYYFGYIRHHGHLYLLLISCLWLMQYYPEGKVSFRWEIVKRYYDWLHRNFPVIFGFMLIVQVMAAAYAVTIHFMVPFSAARETAGFIRQEKLDRFLIAGDQDVSLESIAGYLNQETYFFSRKQSSKYLIYDTLRHIPSRDAVMKMADGISEQYHDTILLVMNYPLNTDSATNLKKIASFEQSIQYDEIYFLYMLIPLDTNQQPSFGMKQQRNYPAR